MKTEGTLVNTTFLKLAIAMRPFLKMIILRLAVIYGWFL